MWLVWIKEPFLALTLTSTHMTLNLIFGRIGRCSYIYAWTGRAKSSCIFHRCQGLWTSCLPSTTTGWSRRPWASGCSWCRPSFDNLSSSQRPADLHLLAALTDLRGLSASRRTSERWFFRRQQGYDRMRERQYITYRYISYIFLLNAY